MLAAPSTVVATQNAVKTAKQKELKVKCVVGKVVKTSENIRQPSIINGKQSALHIIYTCVSVVWQRGVCCVALWQQQAFD